MTMRAINPATGKLIREYPELSAAQARRAVDETHQAFQDWQQVSFRRRSELVRRVATLLRQRKPSYARLMAEEMGKPFAQGEAESEKCAWVCDYYAEHAARLLSNELVKTEARKSFVAYRPLGVVLAVMPWNFPFWQVFRFAAPALMAGNGAVLKHSSNVPGCALAIEELFQEAGFPEHIFRTLLIGAAQVGDIIAHPRVVATTLTGSTPAGRAVASQSGQLLKKSVLELGGSDPYVILEDAELEEAAATCVSSRLINSGQSCIAAKRFIVVESVREEFERLFVARMRAARVGDPLEPDTDVGPLATTVLRDELHDQVQRSLAQGAKLLLGGELPPGPGAFYPPTVLTKVRPEMAGFDEELFGPVGCISVATDEEDAIRLANHSVFGLGAAVFTHDVARGEQVAAERLQAGCCVVNDLVKSDPRLPFGGIKESGYGRELGEFGIREFVNIKSVVVK
jgi:succinate-semialdehyde dehydrogenase/glutarate-semialdehyde dehydrogenase